MNTLVTALAQAIHRIEVLEDEFERLLASVK